MCCGTILRVPAQDRIAALKRRRFPPRRPPSHCIHGHTRPPLHRRPGRPYQPDDGAGAFFHAAQLPGGNWRLAGMDSSAFFLLWQFRFFRPARRHSRCAQHCAGQPAALHRHSTVVHGQQAFFWQAAAGSAMGCAGRLAAHHAGVVEPLHAQLYPAPPVCQRVFFAGVCLPHPALPAPEAAQFLWSVHADGFVRPDPCAAGANAVGRCGCRWWRLAGAQFLAEPLYRHLQFYDHGTRHWGHPDGYRCGAHRVSAPSGA